MTRIPTTPSDIRQLAATLQVVAEEYESIAARMEEEGISDIPARGTSTFMHHVAKIEGNVNSIMKTLQDAIRDKRKAPAKRPTQVSTSKLAEIPGVHIGSSDKLPESEPDDDGIDQPVGKPTKKKAARKSQSQAKSTPKRKSG